MTLGLFHLVLTFSLILQFQNGVKEALFHRLMGPIQHSIESIDCLNSHRVITVLNTSSFQFDFSVPQTSPV